MDSRAKHGNGVRSVVIVGGGSAGWMTAAALAKVLGPSYCQITLIESDTINTVSVGEATIPQIQLFNKILDVDEKTFMAATQATFKLGIEFEDWKRQEHKYFHPFGSYGTHIDALPFHHYWLKQFNQGLAPELENYSLAALAAREGRFCHPQGNSNSPLSAINYAYHFDATLYANFLSKYAMDLGVTRIVGTVAEVVTDTENGFISSLMLTDGQQIDGELFIDCSGFKGLLIEQTLKTGYHDWSAMLPCNRAVAAPSKSNGNNLPFTNAKALAAGWRWRIPLQHRTGNGYVYASEFCTQNNAESDLIAAMESAPIADFNHLKWVTGMRKKAWNKNCVAIGLSAGFIEPLESTGLHLIQSSIAKLLTHFPTTSFPQIDIDTFNRQIEKEYLSIRDFVILHYKATARSDTEFWRYCKDMPIPGTLSEKLALYQENGRIFRENEELFNETSWLAVMHGQGVKTSGYHPLVDRMPNEQLVHRLSHIQKVIRRSVDAMPRQSEYLRQYLNIG